MAAKPPLKKKTGGTRRTAGENYGKLVVELKDRIAVLENELRSWQEGAAAHEFAGRRQADEAIQVANRIVENSQVIVFRWGASEGWPVEFVSRNVAIFGYGPEEFTSGKISYASIVHPEDLRRVMLEVWDYSRRGINHFRQAYRILTKDRQIRWVDDRTLIERDAGGTITHYQGVIIDITERRSAEEALSESYALLKTITCNTPDQVYVKDHQGRFIFANPAVLDFFGKPPEEVLGKQPSEFYTDTATLSTIMENDRRIMKSGQTEFLEEVALTSHGPCTYLSTKTPRRNGKGEVVGLIGISRDINELKRAETVLRESEERFRVLADTSPTMIIVYQGDELVYANRMTMILTGYTIDELQQMKFWEWVEPEYQEMVKKYGYAIQRGEQAAENYEIRIRTIGGDLKWVEVAAGRIDFTGKPAGIATFFDITERKQAEEVLGNAKQRAELYLDLMGHDISNMHQIALGYLEIAADVTPQDDGRREFLVKSIEVLQRSARLIGNVRKLQKLSDGMFQMQDIDAVNAIQTVHREFEAVPGKPISLDLNGHDRCLVRANELLYDVFANLVSNAIKYTRVRADINIGLDIVSDNGGRYCRVCVEDSGPGVLDDFKGIIFNRALQGTKNTKGMGLGLYLVKSLVESYGGRVWVEDRVPGDHMKGARFVVMLPALEK